MLRSEEAGAGAALEGGAGWTRPMMVHTPSCIISVYFILAAERLRISWAPQHAVAPTQARPLRASARIFAGPYDFARARH